MINKFSKWLLYIASYFPFYIILIARLLMVPVEKETPFTQALLSHFNQHLYIIITLIALFCVSFGVITKVKRLKPNEKTRSKLVKNCTGQMASFFIPFIVSMLTIGIDKFGQLIFAVSYFLCGCAVIQADWVHIFPIFFYTRCRLYQAENGLYVLSRLNIEQFNQLLLDNPDGIEVRCLTPKLLLTCGEKF